MVATVEGGGRRKKGPQRVFFASSDPWTVRPITVIGMCILSKVIEMCTICNVSGQCILLEIIGTCIKIKMKGKHGNNMGNL